MNGEYQHSLDAKGRVFLPAKLREELGDNVFVSKGLDNCLFIYAEEQWLKMAEKLSAMPISKARKLQRAIFPSAARFELDAQGRMLLPQKLREHAFLDKEVVIVGAGNRAEIWDAGRWQQFEAEYLTEDAMAEAMDELGF